MYFSLIMPMPGSEPAAAREWASGPYAEHQWLWRYCPAPEGHPRDFLFRRSDVQGAPRFYVVSQRPPQPTSDAWQVQTREYQPQIAAGERLCFDLRANPVISHERDGKPKRDDVVMQKKTLLLQDRGLRRWKDWHDEDKPPLYELVHETCSDWLKDRASRHGFEVVASTLATDAYQRHAEKGGRLRFSTVDFSGELIVTEAGAFRRSLWEGIGHAKAFGCGLLLVRRLG